MGVKECKAGLVCLSDPNVVEMSDQNEELYSVLEGMGIEVSVGNCIYEKDIGEYYSSVEKAEDVMRFYKDEQIDNIFDISGGDLANDVLPYLDYDVIAKSCAIFWGYSDLTTVINAIYTKTGKSSVLYQAKNLVWADSENQQNNFSKMLENADNKLFEIESRFVQGSAMQGIVLGGNIRCFLKLAGTPYFPDVENKILFLESRSGRVEQMRTCLNQLKQIGVFDSVAGVLLGTFTQMESLRCKPKIEELILEYVDETVSVAKTADIGHGIDSKALRIGEYMKI